MGHFIHSLCDFWEYSGRPAKIQRTRANALKHFEFFNAERPEYLSPKIHDIVHKSAPPCYAMSSLPLLIEKLLIFYLQAVQLLRYFIKLDRISL